MHRAHSRMSEIIAHGSYARSHTAWDVAVEVTWKQTVTVRRPRKHPTLYRNAPEVPPPSVKMAVGLDLREAGLRLRNKFGGEDGG